MGEGVSLSLSRYRSPSLGEGHDIPISGQQFPGVIGSGEPAQSRYGKKDISWPDIQKLDLLGSVSHGPFKKTKAEVAINLVVHVSGGGTDSVLGSLRGFHKSPLDGVSSSVWEFTVAAAVKLMRKPIDRSEK